MDYIKKFFKRKLIEYIEQGMEWVIISGNLGTELWMGEVALDLKADYPELKLAVLLPYTNFSSKWNEVNQMYYNSIIERADYINYTSKSGLRQSG
ncbi:MAG: SLOG family protein [Alkalibacterium sp.]|nr:SLOG family protein [Alkalibacterium sp.]